MINRARIARISVLISILAQSLSYILNFCSRKIILISLGVEYLGLNSTLTQVLGALSVTELGIQTVIIYKMYKPVVEGDKAKICELMSIIRFFYRIVALLIICISVLFLPFLNLIITDISISWNQIYYAWIMMAASSALSYLMNFNSTIIYADQKQYVYQGVNLIINLVIVTTNLFVLYILKSYYIYLAISMIGVVSGNIILVILRKKMYPWVYFTKATKTTVIDVAKDSFYLFFGRLAGYVFNSTDSIVVSIFISTSLVGYLGNYSTISCAVMYFISSICAPIQAIVGNMLVSEKRAFLHEFIKKFTYVLFFIGSCLSLPTALLLDDFVELLYGNDYILNHTVVYLLILYVILTSLQTATGSLLDADGQFRIEKSFYIISSILNIVLSVIGAITIGIEGVLLASVIGILYLLICRVYYCYKIVVMDLGPVLFQYIFFITKLFFMFICIWWGVKCLFDLWFNYVSIYMFIVKGTLSFLAVVVCNIIFWGRTSEFRYFMTLIGLTKQA